MKTTMELTKRNILLFFRNKTQVFFSFLAIIIILGLYILFLADVQIRDLKNTLGDIKGAAALINAWVMSGLLAVSTVTIALGSLGRIVRDREDNAIRDLLVSPIKRTSIFVSYILSTLFISFIISLIFFLITEIYIVSVGGTLLTLMQMLEVLGVIILCVVSSSLMMLFFVSYLKSVQSFAILSNIVGTLIGFVTGAYVPIGLLPKGVQMVANALPVSQGASLFRQIFMDTPMKEVFANAPNNVLVDYQNQVGVHLYINGFKLTPLFMILMIIGSILLFGILNAIRFKKMKD